MSAKAKLTISLPEDLLAGIRSRVRAGRAKSVSGYVAQVLADQEPRESLNALLKDLIERHGKPSPKDVRWAQRALAPRRD